MNYEIRSKTINKKIVFGMPPKRELLLRHGSRFVTWVGLSGLPHAVV